MKSKYEAVKAYKEKHKIKRVPLDIPEPLYREFKSVVEQRGDKITSVLRKAIEDYINNGVIITEHQESDAALTRLNESIRTQKPSKLVESIVEEPNQSSNLKWWERSIPSKYRGQFATYAEFTDYIRTNDLLSELETDLDS